METFRTSHPTYVPPDRCQIASAAAEVKLENYSVPLVEDFCNLASGGVVNPPAEYKFKILSELRSEISAGGWLQNPTPPPGFGHSRKKRKKPLRARLLPIWTKFSKARFTGKRPKK